MSTCLKHSTVVGCWNKADNTKENVVIHYTYATNASGVEILKATRYTTSDGTPITLGVGDTVTPGVCPIAEEFDIKEREVCVNLDGDTTVYEVIKVYKRSKTTGLATLIHYESNTGVILTGDIVEVCCTCDSLCTE